MDEALIANWNKWVSPKDKVYHLGDAVINRKNLHLLGRLNGRKVLIKGNHDNFKAAEYLMYFEDLKGVHVMDDLVLTHIPVSNKQFYRYRGNIHGHLHDKTMGDERYYNVSVERHNFTPVLFEKVREHFARFETTMRNN